MLSNSSIVICFYIYVIFEHITLPYSRSFSRYSGVCFDFQWKETSCLCILHQLYYLHEPNTQLHNNFNRIYLKIYISCCECLPKILLKAALDYRGKFVYIFQTRCVQCVIEKFFLGVKWMDHFHKVSVGLNDFLTFLFISKNKPFDKLLPLKRALV